MVAQGITYPFLIGVLKSIFVETAASGFMFDGRYPTDSRLTLLTGVHRKDIRRLLREPAAETETPAGLTLGTQIVARWLGDHAYSDLLGQPRALALLGFGFGACGVSAVSLARGGTGSE